MSSFDARNLLSALQRAKDAPDTVKDRMLGQAEELLARAQAEAPVDTGDLVSSGHIEHGPEGPEVVFDAPYALVVHERVDLHHPKGGAKYLERSVLDLQPEFIEQYQTALEEALSG